jgi:hypothetical protein
MLIYQFDTIYLLKSDNHLFFDWKWISLTVYVFILQFYFYVFNERIYFEKVTDYQYNEYSRTLSNSDTETIFDILNGLNHRLFFYYHTVFPINQIVFSYIF